MRSHKNGPRSYITVLSIAFIFFLICPDSKGQDIGMEYGVSQTGYTNVLEQPAGLGGHLNIPVFGNIGIPVIKGIGLRLGASRHTEDLTITRSRCTGFVEPGTDCSMDTFDGDSHISSYGLGLIIRFQSLMGKVRPEIYALRTITNIDVDFIGRQSGKNIGPVTPNENARGFEVGGTVNYEITPFLDLYGNLALQHPNIESCLLDAWSPFCEERKVYQFSLGTQLRLGEVW